MRRRYNPLAADMKKLAETMRKRAEENRPSPAPVAPSKPSKKPTKVEYKKLLAEHDWDFDYSDDYSTWKKGSEQKKVLQAMQVVLDPDLAIWNRYARKGKK